MNTYVLMENKFLRANQGEFTTKEFNKPIVNRSMFWNKYLKEKSAD